MGEVESAKESLELLADEISVFGQGGLTLEHVLERLGFEDCPTYEEAEKIIGEKLITDIQETNTTFINNNKDNIELIVSDYKWENNDYLIKLASEKEKVFTEVTLEVLLTAKELNMTLEEAKEEVEGSFLWIKSKKKLHLILLWNMDFVMNAIWSWAVQLAVSKDAIKTV